MAEIVFDATQHKPKEEFKPIPNGTYLALIEKSEVSATKAGTGKRLNLTFQIIDEGEYKGRKIFHGLNIENPNPTAVEIALTELSAICHAVGVLQPQDYSELHDKPLKIKVKVAKRKDTGENRNEIDMWFDKNHVAQSTGGTGEDDPYSRG